MKKLLLITGDLATGKSTFSNILSQRYKVNVFFKDSIKEVLGDTIGFTDRAENKKLSEASMWTVPRTTDTKIRACRRIS